MGLLWSTFHANLQALSKGHFYPTNKFQELTEKNMNVLHTVQGYCTVVSLNIESLEKPWKLI